MNIGILKKKLHLNFIFWTIVIDKIDGLTNELAINLSNLEYNS
ncbi:hypothetical protein [Methanobrevibacter curvatus]|uniref:Uncharacterized protein n=1 Tax=Methanobrevibacter curvatus TaxID=49547 RepID=A0A166AK69_9EURY|nr:hypothetical protein [Methanobrevibacter curvatus]KZX12141.1 hypothetical protein MBCUR_11500 [Methanobrevibacter curvatus]